MSTNQFRVLIAIIILVGLSILGGIWRVETIARDACAGQNEVRSEVIKSNDDLLDPIEKAMRSAITSPTVLPRQKATLSESLARITTLRQAQHGRLKPKTC